MSLKSILLASRASTTVSAQGLSENDLLWSSITQYLAGSKINSVCWTGTCFVAVGINGYIWRSDATGTIWEIVQSAQGAELYSVAARNATQLRASGLDGRMLRSEDGGSTWTYLYPKGVLQAIWDVCHAVGPFWLYATNDGRIMYDVFDKAGEADTLFVGETLYTVAAGSLGYVVGGVHGVYYSRNLLSFQKTLSAPNSTIRGIVASDTCFVAVGLNKKIYRSVNGRSWTEVYTAPGQLIDVTWTGAMFVACGRLTNDMLSSQDGIVWTVRRSNIDHILHSIAASPDALVAATSSGLIRIGRK